MYFVLAILTVAAGADLSTLTPQQREVYNKVARDEFCSCTSSLTLAACGATKPLCKTADHLSQILARISQTGLTSAEISEFMSSRVSGPFCAKPKTFAKIDEAPSKGAKDAPLTLIEFADFRCPHCRDAASRVKQAVTRYAKRVKFVFVPFPLQDHPLSVAAAAAFFAAGEQKKQWEMQEALFTAKSIEFDQKTLNDIAKSVGLDVKKFETDMNSKPVRDRVASLKQAALEFGVQATPTFLVNGHVLEPDPELLTFDDRFEMELDRNNGTCQ